MITEKMSYEEIAKEFKIDWDSNLDKQKKKITHQIITLLLQETTPFYIETLPFQ